MNCNATKRNEMQPANCRGSANCRFIALSDPSSPASERPTCDTLHHARPTSACCKLLPPAKRAPEAPDNWHSEGGFCLFSFSLSLSCQAEVALKCRPHLTLIVCRRSLGWLAGWLESGRASCVTVARRRSLLSARSLANLSRPNISNSPLCWPGSELPRLDRPEIGGARTEPGNQCNCRSLARPPARRHFKFGQLFFQFCPGKFACYCATSERARA